MIPACNGVFYQPSREIQVTPARLDFPFEDVYFPSGDGTLLNGWFIPGRGKIKGTILQFHGNGVNMGNHYGAVYWLPDEGFNVFLFDYRGYGNSEGTASREGVQADALAAIRYVQARKDVARGTLVLYGQSLGGSVAAYAAARQDREGVGAVILESTFFEYRKIAREKLGAFFLTWPFQWPLSFLVSNEYSAGPVVSEIAPIPLLIVHGDQDGIVPVSNADLLYAAAKEPKTLWIIPGAGHISAFSPDRIPERLRLVQFLDKILEKQ